MSDDTEQDALYALPLLVTNADPTANQRIALIVERSNAREVILAAQECVERVKSDLHSGNESEDTPSSVRQLITLATVYSTTIPRLTSRKSSPADTVRPLVRELGSALQLAAPEVSVAEGRDVVKCVSVLVCSAVRWAQPSGDDAVRLCQDALRDFFCDTLSAYACFIQSALAKRKFYKLCPRYAGVGRTSRLEVDEEHWRQGENVASAALEAANALSISTDSVSPFRPVTLANVILLAHAPSPHSPPHPITLLSALLPTLLAALHPSTADEPLALLLSLLDTPPDSACGSTIPPEMASSLLASARLPLLAIGHPDAGMRHAALHVIRVILARCSPGVRLTLLDEMLRSPETMMPMNVAAVGFLREAIMAWLGVREKEGVWACKEVMRRLGGVVFKFRVVDGDSEQREWEEKRLVECLSLVFLWLSRDKGNCTGIRDTHTVRSIESSLLTPLEEYLSRMNDKIGMGMVALSVGLERVRGAIAD